MTLFTIFALSSDAELSIISQGLTEKSPSFQNVVIKNKEELKKVWGELGIADEIPSVDFIKELVIVIVPKGKSGSSVEISRLERKANDIEVRFIVRPPTAASKTYSVGFPYIMAKLYPLDVKSIKVQFIEDLPKPPIPAGTAIGQVPQYTNVLKEYKNISISQFLPLDKGNLWTYRVESKGKAYEETYSVLSISQDGWSIFDNFFGQKQIAIRIDPLGNIFVSSDEGMQAFYTPEIQKSFKRSEFLTPAGKFDDLMVVSIPRTDRFWFKDVYARGVGLIYHEHQSPKGTVKYTLIKAQVRGKKYP